MQKKKHHINTIKYDFVPSSNQNIAMVENNYNL